MPLLDTLQSAIHKVETGRGSHIIKYVVVALVVVFVWGMYDIRCFQDMAAPEAMDAAQLARNISRRRGFTTEFVRPLSIHLVREKNSGTSPKDPAELNSGHPDLANAPAYPTVLAGLMKILPFNYTIDSSHHLARYQPDFLIALFNQVLFMGVIVLAFFWARRLFDAAVAWTSVVVLLGTEVLWHFSISGLSTMLLLLIFMAVLWCLTLYERECREPKWGKATPVVLSIAAGLLTGLGGLTRYSYLWTIVPVVIFLGSLGGPRRAIFSLAALAAFAAVMGPWVARNYALSGTPFGTASYSVIERFFPEFHLQRSLQPALPYLNVKWYWFRLANNLVPIFETDIFKAAGGWITAFFLVGLMIGFRSPALRRLRYFIVATFVTLAIVQALGNTQLSDETPEINSENLLVLLVPVVLVYSVGIFFLLLDTLKLPFFQMRYLAIGVCVVVLWIPMLFILSAAKSPIVYPPYRPDIIQSSTALLGEKNLMMSDIPWAVAWYGDRQCVWLTLNATVIPANAAANTTDPQDWQESFFAINDSLKTIHALYLTPRTLDKRFLSDWVRAGEWSWLNFVTETTLRREVPGGFPLTKIPPHYWPEQMFLCDWELY